MIRDQRVRVFWSYRQVCTQDAASGNLEARITPAANSAMIVKTSMMAASGNRAVAVDLYDADANRQAYVNNIAAAASATATTPVARSAAGTSAGYTGGEDTIVPNPMIWRAVVASAAQTETATLCITAELLGTTTAPTVSWASSTGTPNAAAATENAVTVVQVMA